MKGFGALAQGTGTFLFLRNYVILAVKGVGADLLEYAAPKIAEVVSKLSRQLQGVFESKFSEKN